MTAKAAMGTVPTGILAETGPRMPLESTRTGGRDIDIRQRPASDERMTFRRAAGVVRHPQVFVLTLHDEIFTTARGIPPVVGAFEAAFNRIGYPMRLKVA